MRVSIRTVDRATVRLLDVLVAVWLVLWLVVGVWAGVDLWHLADLGDSVTRAGQALGSAGEALRSLGALPVVGDRPAELGDQVLATAADIVARGEESQTRLHQLAWLLAVAVAVMPTAPVVGLYLPLRLARHREVSDLRRALNEHGFDPALRRLLAVRALGNLPLGAVRTVTADPWGDLAGGRVDDLARAELARLGVVVPRDR